MAERFEKNARTVSLLTLVSRVTGLARDAALARVFGLSPVIDAFWFAFIIPNLFRRLFGEGALSAAFLPAFSKLDRDDPTTARRLATLTISVMIVALGGLTLISEIVLYVLLQRTAEGDNTALALRLMMITLPYMPLVCVVAILGAMLQVHGRFGPMAAAPIVLNLCIVAAACGFAAELGDRPRDHISLIAWSVVVAGTLQLIWTLWALRSHAWWSGVRDSSGAIQPFRSMLNQAWPMILGLGVLQLNAFFDNLIASYPTSVGPTILGHEFPLKPGALTALSNAQRLYEFPLGVFGIAVATAIFPALVRRAGQDDREAFAAMLRRGLRLVIFIGLPASAGLMLVRDPLTAVVFQGGDFTPADTKRVSFVLLGYAPAIWAYSMTHTLTRAFYAKGDSMTPVKVAVAIVLLNIVLNVTLIWTPLKEAGLAWSTAICAMIQTIILLRVSRRHADHLVDREVRASWFKTAAVTALMAGGVFAIDSVLMPVESLAGTWKWALLRLCTLVGIGAVLVWMTSKVFAMPERRWALGKAS